MKHTRTGQAVVELAIFGAIILFVVGVLLNYMQQANDDQHIQMEAFRRALAYAGIYPVFDFGRGAGASVDFTLVRDRKYAGVSGNFKKGEGTRLSADASVYWAVPKVGLPSDNLRVYRVNEDENPINLATLFGFLSRNDIGKYISFGTKSIGSIRQTDFLEARAKQENPLGIANVRRSASREAITTTIKSAFMPRIPIETDDELTLALIQWLEGEIGQFFYIAITDWEVTQHLFQKDGKYSYSWLAPDADVVRGRTWETPH